MGQLHWIVNGWLATFCNPPSKSLHLPLHASLLLRDSLCVHVRGVCLPVLQTNPSTRVEAVTAASK